jgi:hypothetical protein
MDSADAHCGEECDLGSLPDVDLDTALDRYEQALAAEVAAAAHGGKQLVVDLEEGGSGVDSETLKNSTLLHFLLTSAFCYCQRLD